MSTAECNEISICLDKSTSHSWNELITDSEAKIKTCQSQIDALSKSIVFFKKQESLGIPFPAKDKQKVKRHEVLS